MLGQCIRIKFKGIQSRIDSPGAKSWMNAIAITVIVTIAAVISIILVRSRHPRMASVAPAAMEQLHFKFQGWRSNLVESKRLRSLEVSEFADQDVLDLLRSRSVEQEVLDLLDEPETW